MALKCLALASAASMMLIALQGFPFPNEGDPLERWGVLSKKQEGRQLVMWLRCRAGQKLTGAGQCPIPDIEVPAYFGTLGLFVTLKRGTRVRGCYGAFSHSMTDIWELLSDYLTGALCRDPRHKPLEIGELDNTDIVLTVTSMPSPVSDLASIDTHRYGILLACDGDESTVFVPAEVRSASYLERFMKGKSCQASAFRAVTIR